MPDNQMSLALADRHQGQDANLAADVAVHCGHRHTVETALAVLARTGAPFTADHVHQAVAAALGQPYDANLVSSVMGIWAKDHTIRETTARPTASARRTRHASRNRWWTGQPAEDPK